MSYMGSIRKDFLEQLRFTLKSGVNPVLSERNVRGKDMEASKSTLYMGDDEHLLVAGRFQADLKDHSCKDR